MFKSSIRLQVLSALMMVVVLGAVFILTQHKPAPDIRFPLLDGRELALSSLIGRPVLVTFWASTCIECRKEMPDLVALYEELSPSGFEIIAVAMPYDPPNRVLETSVKMELPYAVALDIDGAAVQAFGNVGVTPSSFLIAPDGSIVLSHTGVLDIDRLRRQVIDMLGPRAVAKHTFTPDCDGPACSG
jgi:peroxiredoxin